MRMTMLLATETTAAAVVQRLSPDLTEAQRRRAEAAILQANPHLADASAFKPGTVVTLPEDLGLKPRRGQVDDDPLGLLASDLGQALVAFQKAQARAFADELRELGAQEAVLKTAEVAEAIKASTEAADLAKALVLDLRRRRKLNEAEGKAHDAVMSGLAKDIDTLSSRRGG